MAAPYAVRTRVYELILSRGTLMEAEEQTTKRHPFYTNGMLRRGPSQPPGYVRLFNERNSIKLINHLEPAAGLMPARRGKPSGYRQAGPL